MRMSAAKACLVRLAEWAHSEANDNRERRNREFTFQELQKMIEMSRSIISDLREVQAKIYPTSSDQCGESCKTNLSTPETSGKLELTDDDVHALAEILATLHCAGVIRFASDEMTETTPNRPVIRQIVRN